MLSAPRLRIPLGTKIAAPQPPGAVLHLYSNLFVRCFAGRRSQFDVKFKSGGSGGIYKTGVTASQHLPEGIVLRMQEDRHASYLDRDLVARVHSRVAPGEGNEIARTCVRSLCCANECLVALVATFAAVRSEPQPNPPEETPVAKQPRHEPMKR